MKWTGNQNAQGRELQNYRDEVLATKPSYSSPTDAGRKIFISTLGADYGEWVGDEEVTDWVRPAAFGGQGYTEPGLLCWVEPQLVDGVAGFAPGTLANVMLKRAPTVNEVLLLLQQYDTDGIGTPGLLPAATRVAWGAYGDLWSEQVWWNAGAFGIAPILLTGFPTHARLVLYDTVVGVYRDGLSVSIT